MFGIDVAFDNPRYLLLGLLIPVVWIWSFRSLSGLGHFRRIMALVMRTIVMALLILALANVQLRRTNNKLTVIYLLDQSASIPQLQREAMVDYVIREVTAHRDDSRRDRASVIVFGRESNIEVPPLDDLLPLAGRLESTGSLRTDATNLASALKLAQATFPEDSSRRVVIVSDGNENLGDARAIARELAEDGVGIDVIPAILDNSADVAVERVALPSDIRKGQPFETRIVLNNLKPPTGDPSTDNVRGKLRVIRRRGSREEVLSTPEIELRTGMQVYRFKHEIDEPDFYEYQVEFVADDSADDRLSENNRATAFTHVSGQGHVLVIEDWEHRDENGDGEFKYMIDRLRAMNMEVTVQFSDQLFSTLGDLQRYDTVILANVPRASGSDADNLTNFSDAQVQMLLRNTRQMGCGLVMLGGPDSFGAGGWSNTELEKAMPVDFQIHNAKVQAVGALAMIMHASELAQGNHWQKVVSREALKTLGPQDYCGVIHWDDTSWKEGWLWGKPNGLLRVGGNRDRMIALVDRMTPGDMPEFEPAMKIALAGFNTVPQAAVKHMIIISDGDPSPPRFTTVRRLKAAGVKISTVAIGTHGRAASSILNRIATQTGGKYYVVRDPNMLPRIYQKEARRVARPLVVERPEGMSARIQSTHEILDGIDRFPPFTGFVMTSLKESGLPEVPIVSSYPAGQKKNATLLATWNYGAGRAVVFTTDAGRRWATQWTGWEQYDKFFSQLVQWSMRPTGDTGNFSVTTTLKDRKVRVVVDALDKDDQFLNFLDVSGSVVAPNMDSADVQWRQTAPGRYIAEFDADQAGSYFLNILPGAGRAPIRTGINVPYSPEFRDRESNEALLKALASLAPEGGTKGKVIPGRLVATSEQNMDDLLKTDTFRRDLAPAVTSNYVWPWLALITGCIFVGDVFVRRVAINFAWVLPMLAATRDLLLRREAEQVQDQRMERLRSQKAQISETIDRQRAATRFEPQPDEEVGTDALTEAAMGAPADQPRRAATKQDMSPQEEEETYTMRLLKAKQEARKQTGGRNVDEDL